MRFRQFLKTKLKDENAIGDFARDALDDPNFPKRTSNPKTILKYLELDTAAIPEAIEAAQDALMKYQLLTKKWKKLTNTQNSTPKLLN